MARSIPTVDTRQVLLEHLLGKVTALCTSRLTAKEITLEISNNLDNARIIDLLQNEKSLLETIYKSKAYFSDKDELGEQLFLRVSAIESDLCAKITGMLLELDVKTIRQMLADNDLLVEAVGKAKREYLEFIKDNKRKEEYGEIIYERIRTSYDDNVARHLTGMLLEMSVENLERLFTNENELHSKIKLAYETFVQYRST